MDRHLLISSDRHAGLPSAQYRDDLDPQYRERFDVEFAAVQGQLPTAGELPEMREENAPGTRIGPEKSIFQD
ncbi:MAG: hypothetical protein CL933_08055 [Deltaproteobacteria bacterium]|nr:hypothetical protein [Deltaproteobacteria bacterium]